MNDTQYTYAVAYMKTLENKMLTSQEIDALIGATDVNSALKILTDKGYGENSASINSIDEILDSESEKIWAEAKNVCPEGAPLEILIYQNDFHNAKTILKAFISGQDWEHLLLKPYIVEPHKIFEAIKSADFEDLAEFIKEPLENAYKLICQTHDGQLVEVFLDKEALKIILKRAKQEKSEFLSQWVDLNIDIANMKTAIRAIGKDKEFIKNAIVETSTSDILIEAALISKEAVINSISQIGYSEALGYLNESFSAFEKWCDNKKMQFIKKAKMSYFGFEPILAFMIGKEFELQAVRIILAGKQNNVPTQIIRERLRDLYA